MSLNPDPREVYLEIWDDAYPWNFIFDIYDLIVCNIAIVLCSTILIAIFKENWSKTKIDTKLSAYMILFDLGCSITMTISAIANLAKSDGLVRYKHLCSIDAIIVNVLYASSINFVGLISLHRCLLIRFKRTLSDSFYNTLATIIVGIPVAIDILGWATDGLGIQVMGIYCLYDYHSTIGRLITIPIVIDMSISQTCTIVGYILISLHRREESRKEQLELGLDPKIVQKEINRTIFRSLLIVCCNIFTVSPYAVLFLMTVIDPKLNSVPLEGIGAILITSNVITNSVIILYIKPDLVPRVKAVWGY